MHLARSPFIALAVTAMMGKRSELGDLADRPHGFVTVHLRHHDVHQNAIDARCLEQRLDAGAAVLGVNHLQVMLLQNTGQCKDVADVVVHHQYLLARQRNVVAADGCQNGPLIVGEVGVGAMQEQHGLFQQAFIGLRKADDTRPRELPDLGLQLGGQVVHAGEDDRAASAGRFRPGSLPPTVIAGISGRRRSITTPSRYCCFSDGQGFSAGPDGENFDAVSTQQLPPGCRAGLLRRSRSATSWYAAAGIDGWCRTRRSGCPW